MINTSHNTNPRVASARRQPGGAPDPQHPDAVRLATHNPARGPVGTARAQARAFYSDPCGKPKHADRPRRSPAHHLLRRGDILEIANG